MTINCKLNSKKFYTGDAEGHGDKSSLGSQMFNRMAFVVVVGFLFVFGLFVLSLACENEFNM